MISNEKISNSNSKSKYSVSKVQNSEFNAKMQVKQDASKGSNSESSDGNTSQFDDIFRSCISKLQEEK